MRTSSLLSLVTTITAAAAQQVAYGQCTFSKAILSFLKLMIINSGGGVGWTGPTSCVSGYYCSDLNAYYYQCIPGSGRFALSCNFSCPLALLACVVDVQED
jgi:hypothetical protein